MSIGITEEHRELGASLREWATNSRGRTTARDFEGTADPHDFFARCWSAQREFGVSTIALDDSAGGGGGTLVDVAVALEACAHALVPGPLWAASVAVAALRGDGASAALLEEGAAVAVAPDVSLLLGERLTGELSMVWDAAGASHVLAGAMVADVERWFLLPVDTISLTPCVGLDLTRRAGTARVDVALDEVVEVSGPTSTLVQRLALTLAAAEASGIARWCLETAVAHASVREQFGRPIGSFQAVKHLCAEMLEAAESITAVAWDSAVACDSADEEQADFAAAVAGTVALDGAVRVAQSCIQVLGGIGFTFEHDAHLYLRRAVALRSLLGSGDLHARQVADTARQGVRRSMTIDLGGRDVAVRSQVRGLVAEVAAGPDDARRRTVLAECGLLAPHWPEPYGLGADAVTQLVVDQELAEAGLARPDLKIGAWAVPTILAHGSAAQQVRFVRPTLVGEMTWCQLFSEPGAGSDLASLRTRAVRHGNGWRLTGQKVWTSLAQEADWGICLARTDPDVAQHRGITYFLLDMSSPGIEIRPLREMTGDALFNEVFLDDVFVPDECVVGQPGEGWQLTRTTLANERVAMATTRLEVSTEGALAELGPDASEYDRVRVGHAVALSTICALLGLRATLKALAGSGPGAESSVAKLLGVRSRQNASELLVDLMGPRVLLGGADVDAAVHEMLLTRCLSIAGGTTQILRNVVAERILGLPR